MADVTEQTPLAAPRPKSRKRIVAATAVLSVALGYSAVRAVNRRFMAFPAPDPVQIRLRANTNYCLGIKDWQVADKRSEVILVRCSSNPAGQEFQVGGSGGEIKYKAPGRTLCVNGKGGGDFTVGSSFQLYSCKDDDKNSEFTYALDVVGVGERRLAASFRTHALVESVVLRGFGYKLLALVDPLAVRVVFLALVELERTTTCVVTCGDGAFSVNVSPPLCPARPRPSARRGGANVPERAALQARSELVVCGVFLKRRRLERKVEVSGFVI